VFQNDPTQPGQLPASQTFLTASDIFLGQAILSDMNGDGLLDVILDSGGATIYLQGPTVSVEFTSLSPYGPSRHPGDQNYLGSVSNSQSTGGSLAPATWRYGPTRLWRESERQKFLHRPGKICCKLIGRFTAQEVASSISGNC
jgi:hypothetical protein